jgi:hypothetical protein
LSFGAGEIAMKDRLPIATLGIVVLVCIGLVNESRAENAKPTEEDGTRLFD